MFSSFVFFLAGTKTRYTSTFVILSFVFFLAVTKTRYTLACVLLWFVFFWAMAETSYMYLVCYLRFRVPFLFCFDVQRKFLCPENLVLCNQLSRRHARVLVAEYPSTGVARTYFPIKQAFVSSTFTRLPLTPLPPLDALPRVSLLRLLGQLSADEQGSSSSSSCC